MKHRRDEQAAVICPNVVSLFDLIIHHPVVLHADHDVAIVTMLELKDESTLKDPRFTLLLLLLLLKSDVRGHAVISCRVRRRIFLLMLIMTIYV